MAVICVDWQYLYNRVVAFFMNPGVMKLWSLYELASLSVQSVLESKLLRDNHGFL